MTEEVKKKIVDSYNRGEYSIVDIARLNNVSVDDVLMATGNEDLMTVTFQGDMIDENEVAGTNATINRRGATYKQSFTKN